MTPFPSLWINEVQADNLTGITNRAGQHTGWVEIYNPSTNLLSLSGLYLANNYTNLLQWAFPTNATINPGQFKVIFADAQTNLSTTNELHTSFILPSGSGSVALTRLSHQRPAPSARLCGLPEHRRQRFLWFLPRRAEFQPPGVFPSHPRRPQQRHRPAAAVVRGLYHAGFGLYAKL